MASRFDPFRELDRMAERMLGSAAEMGQSLRAMPMDIYRAGDHYVLRCDLPGIDPGSLDVGVDGRMLTIRARRSQPEQDVEWLTQERFTGSFARQIALGDGLDLEKLDATYTNGVLTVTIPLAEKAKPRRVEVSYHAEPAIGGATAAGIDAGGKS